MAVSYGQIACPSNAPTLILAAANVNTVYSGGAGRARSVVLLNVGAWDAYLGDASVTKATGLLLKSGAAAITLYLNQGESLYAISAANTATVSYLATGA